MLVSLGDVTSNLVSFIQSNWLGIVTLILTVLGLIGTPYYLRNRVSSAQQERYNQAKNSLLDVLENQIINDKELSEERLNNLRSAIERRYSVSISDRISSIQILQDLQLRIEESKLDTEDKEDYSSAIETKIEMFQEERRIEDLPSEYQLAIQELQGVENIQPETLVEEIEKAREQRREVTSGGLIEVMSYLISPSKMNELPSETRRNISVMGMALIIVYVIFAYFVLFN